MLIITDDDALYRAPLDDPLKRLLLQRRAEWGEDLPLDHLAHIIVMRARDTLDDLARQTVRDLGIGTGDPEWEYVIDHGTFCETVFILSDNGFGLVILVEKEGIGPVLAKALTKACA